MKIIITSLMLCFTYINAFSQCNTSHSSEVLSSFNASCNGHSIKGSINNTIILSASCGNLRFTPPIVDISEYTSATDLDMPYELFISPNPFMDRIKISLDMDVRDYTIAIFNILGQQVMSEDHFSTGETYYLDVAYLQAGTYFLLIQSEDKLRATQKIIKID